MSEPNLFDYQIRAKQNTAILYRKGYKKVLTVLPGGGGKTVIASSITKDYHHNQQIKINNLISQEYSNQTGKKVAFFTHRDELFSQAREKQLAFGNVTEPINSETSQINSYANTFVCMVETFDRRSISDNFLSYFKDVGLIFIDEAHRADFNKIMHHFEGALFDGLTATPISSDKSKPMNKVWDIMFIAATKTELLELNAINPNVGIVPCDCYSFGKVDRDKLSKKGIDFDEKKMAKDFSDDIQVRNVIENYEDLGKGMKGLCFNVNISHNELMHHEFLNIGVNSRILHSKADKFYGAPKSSLAKNWRKDTIKWFRETEGALINNVGILTTGFDEKSTELIMTNFASLSISKVEQCEVRGARPYQYPNGQWKEFYRWLDFGKNCNYFNIDGNNNIPWQLYYDMPNSKHNTVGVAAVKTCPECGALNPVSTRFCKGFKKDWLSQEVVECGYMFPLSERKEDLIPRTMVKFITDGINVQELISNAKFNGYDIKSVYWKILEKVSQYAKKSFETFILKEQFDFLLYICFKKLRELSKVTGKRVWRDSVKSALSEKMRKDGFILDVKEVGNKEILEEIKN